jgi:hypothetical protein
MVCASLSAVCNCQRNRLVITACFWRSAEEVAVSLIVAPAQCYLPPGYPARRYWGIAAQLYGLRSQKNWGIGDFGDLNTLTDWAASLRRRCHRHQPMCTPCS